MHNLAKHLEADALRERRDTFQNYHSLLRKGDAAKAEDRAGILAAEEAIADAAIGTPGDFPGPLFAALPPAELEWPYRGALYEGAPKIDGDAYDRMIAAARGKNDDYGFRHALLSFIGEGIAEKLGTRGAPISLTTACASGATAIQLSVEAIRRGDTDAAISIGADCSVNPEMMIRFHLLGSVQASDTLQYMHGDRHKKSRPISWTSPP